ncbi:MAG: hypothetical protein K5894_02595 [Lachnospiraceae bacterium]|nr:hypothetical protein [Lachnospiraceae bacterium]
MAGSSAKYKDFTYLAPGDMIIVGNAFGKNFAYVDDVAKTGRIILTTGDSFYPLDGLQVGGDKTHPQRLFHCTEEAISEVHNRQQIVKTLHQLKEITSLTYDQAIMIEAVLKSDWGEVTQLLKKIR